MAKNRPYLYYDQTISLCEECFRRIEAKHVIQDDQVWLHKWCPEHGQSKVLIATDATYWRLGREVYVKAPEMPERFNTALHWGCPYDCGLCPDHMQHSCLTIVEITDYCNLNCPVCYADSAPVPTAKHRSLEQIEDMFDIIVANEIEPDVVQISGGEPTTHPQFFAVLDAAKSRPIKHLMLNTNGVRIANEEGFAEKLAQYAPGFEVYLQFDSFEQDALKTLRGANLRHVRERALDALNRVGLSTTLVMTVARGVNDHEIGAVIEYAAKQPCVRGVTIQPIQFAGRIEGIDHKAQRLTQTEVRQMLLDQTAFFDRADIIPVPCNPDALSMGYALKTEEGIVPLTRYIEPEVLLQGGRNTIVFEHDQRLKEQIFTLFSTNHSPESQSNCLADLLCCLPKIQAPQLSYQNVFRVLIMAFMDAVNFDVRAMKKSCVHIAQPDGRIVPFESFNLLYRDEAQKAVLDKRRAEVDDMFQMGNKA
ncbi:radical SAM protein [Neisseria sp. Ec49-e6-T10]|uniref:radical SAM protein n=1 Tax=Neisseria sp. Ec49-e6-T10 TaxID=3140744 RepID=UPI003EBF3D38